MDENKMIEDLIQLLDSGISNGIGHVNTDVAEHFEGIRKVQTYGCSDCSRMTFSESEFFER